MSLRNHPGILRGMLVALTIAWGILFALRPELFFNIGVNHLGVWFLDAFAILAANDAVARGLDPHLPNPLDYLHRPHVYSHWWLGLQSLGLTRAHVLPLGWAFVASFLTAALAWLRPRSLREVGWYVCVLLSPPVMLSLDRANNDLVVFALLALVVPCLGSPSRWLRLAAAVPIAVAAGLKFYPAVAGLVLLADPDPVEARRRVLFAGVLLAAVGINLAPDLIHLANVVPRAEGLMTFGATNLLEFIGLPGKWSLAAGLALAAIGAGLFLRAGIFDGWSITAEHRPAWLGFIVGSSLITGCFFTGTSYAYRWIFAVWMAPLLWQLPRNPAAPRRIRRLAGLTAALLFYVLWADAVASAVIARFMDRIPPLELVRWADRFFLLEQPVVWAFFICQTGFLAHFVRTELAPLLPPAGRRAGQAEDSPESVR
jgi:hypothetical protein